MSEREFSFSLFYLDEMASLLDGLPRQPIHDAVGEIFRARLYGRTMYVFGGQEDTANALIFARGLALRLLPSPSTRFRITFIADGSSLTLDELPDQAPAASVADQLHAMVNHGDVVVALGLTAQTAPALKAIDQASQAGAITIGITVDEAWMDATDHCIVVPAARQELIEDVSLMLSHAIADALKQ